MGHRKPGGHIRSVGGVRIRCGSEHVCLIAALLVVLWESGLGFPGIDIGLLEEPVSVNLVLFRSATELRCGEDYLE